MLLRCDYVNVKQQQHNPKMHNDHDKKQLIHIVDEDRRKSKKKKEEKLEIQTVIYEEYVYPLLFDMFNVHLGLH